MRILRDFQCPHCEKVQERFVSDEITEIMCDCGEFAYRVIGMPTVMLDGTDPGFPGAWDKWARIREERHRKHAKL